MGKLLLLLNEFLLLRRGEDEVCGRIFLCFAYLLIDVEAVDELTYEKFLAEASRSLVSMRYAEIPLVPGQEIIQRKAPVNPNTAMSLKLD